jgi:hypothetical protein
MDTKMLNMPEQINKLERDIYELAVKEEPTILVVIRHRGEGLWVTITVNRSNQQLRQLAVWTWKDLDRWHSQSGETIVDTLANSIISMAKKIQLHEVA